MTRIEAGGGVHLSEMRESDEPALVRWLNDNDIVMWTAVIPLPYTAADAKSYVARTRERNDRAGRPTEFAIRDAAGLLIGGAGLHGWTPGRRETEIGYWLAKPYWGQGITKAAVRALIDYAAAGGIERFIARVYVGNERSTRLLERLGFVNEGMRPPEPNKRKLEWWYYVLERPRLL